MKREVPTDFLHPRICEGPTPVEWLDLRNMPLTVDVVSAALPLAARTITVKRLTKFLCLRWDGCIKAVLSPGALLILARRPHNKLPTRLGAWFSECVQNARYQSCLADSIWACKHHHIRQTVNRELLNRRVCINEHGVEFHGPSPKGREYEGSIHSATFR